jgi:hypothetical protein
MSSEQRPGGEQTVEAGLWDDGLEQGLDQLAQQTPQPGAGQAA